MVTSMATRSLLTLLLQYVLLTTRSVTSFTLGACDGNPCMNGGQCVDMGTENNPKQFTCACAEGYTGLTCQKRLDPCADEPCQNGGICEPRGEHFHCSCTERFKGKLCEQYIRKRNPCQGDPCGAHGYCEVVNYDFICECSPGFHGSRCEFEEEDEEEPIEVEEEGEPVLIEENEAAENAVTIGWVVLILFIVCVTIAVLVSIHCLRVANTRAKLQAANELRAIAGKEIEPTPGWFETSNDLCYNFFCYCCKLVNKYENDKRVVIIGEDNLPPPPDTVLGSAKLSDAALGLGRSKSLVRSPSKAVSRVGSKLGSGRPSRTSSLDRQQGLQGGDSPGEPAPDFQNNNDGNTSQNRHSRTARGELPGFRSYQGNNYIHRSYREEDMPMRGQGSKMRVRRYIPRSSRDRHRKAYVDILDDEYDDDEYDEEGDYENDDVGPAGNIRGGDLDNVDQMYFDAQCINQSNCFDGDSPQQSGKSVRYDQGGEQSYHRARGRGRSAPGGCYGADDSESEDDSTGSSDTDNDCRQNGRDNDDNDDDCMEIDEQQIVHPRPYNNPRRTLERRLIDADDDDGYSSTGRMSEGDIGGRGKLVSGENGRRALNKATGRSAISYSPHPADTRAPYISPLVNAVPNDRQDNVYTPRHLRQPKDGQYNNPMSCRFTPHPQYPQYVNQPPPPYDDIPNNRDIPRRARSQLAGWDSFRSLGGRFPSVGSTTNGHEYEMSQKKPKVKGILKSTSSYDGHRRTSPQGSHGQGHRTPRHLLPAYSTYVV